MSTRKRPRASFQDEEDELNTSSKYNILPPAKSPLPNAGSTTKKRKLNNYGSGGIAGLKKIVGGIFLGWGKDGKEGGIGEEKDELADEGSSLGNVTGKTKAGKGRGRVKDVFDLPSSGDEEVVVVRKKAKATPKSVGRGKGTLKEKKKLVDVFDVPESDEEVGRVGRGKAGSAKKKGTPVGRLNKKVPVEEEAEEKPKSTRKTSTSGRGKKVYSPTPEVEVEEAELPKSSGRKTGRGRKAIELVRGEEEAPASTKKKVGRVRKVANSEPESEPEEEEEQAPKSSGRKGGRVKKAESPIPSPIHPPPQPSAKKRGRPRKNFDTIIQDAKGTPKGILTPSKGRGLKSKKSVAFEHMDDNIDLGFKDIPVTASVKKSKKVQEVQEEEEVEEHFNNDFCGVCTKTHQRKGNKMVLCDGCEFAVHMKCYNLASLPEGDTWYCKTCRPEESSDEQEEEVEIEEAEAEEEEIEAGEEVLAAPEIAKLLKKGEKAEICCAICSGLDSKPGNMIIICESCEFAVHVKCYNLPTFPKGDWFCRTCLAAAGEDPFNLGIEDDAAVGEANSDFPKIEGFEIHLRRAQRVVLDQLTGQRRIKLMGHDEEMQKVHQVVEQTILAGEGNSMLLIGARGCGKTTVRLHSQLFWQC